jgi:hypothetical protein
MWLMISHKGGKSLRSAHIVIYHSSYDVHGNSLGNFMQLNVNNYIKSALTKEGDAKHREKN